MKDREDLREGAARPEEASQRLRELEDTHRATLNILEDMEAERGKSEDAQRALLNILEDIEEERAKTAQAKQDLEAANKELESFSYSVSHDLRAPLRAISGFSRAAIEDCGPQLDAEGNRYLRLIQENSLKMEKLVDDLLTFSRLGRKPISASEIDMAALAAAVFEELAALEPGRVIEFSVRAPAKARGDAAMMRQVLVNLLSNAIKFSGTRERARIEFGSVAAPKETIYYVKDNGVGFEMEYADQLFVVFQRLHPVSEFEGNGIGLALVQRIIARHGGRTWAESKVNEGATFFFALPARGRQG